MSVWLSLPPLLPLLEWRRECPECLEWLLWREWKLCWVARGDECSRYVVVVTLVCDTRGLTACGGVGAWTEGWISSVFYEQGAEVITYGRQAETSTGEDSYHRTHYLRIYMMIVLPPEELGLVTTSVPLASLAWMRPAGFGRNELGLGWIGESHHGFL